MGRSADAAARLRERPATNEELARKVAEHDQHIAILYEQVDHLLNPPVPKKRRPSGFIHPKDEE